MQMKKVTLSEKEHLRIVKALKHFRGQCYTDDDMLEMDEITSLLSKIDNSPEADKRSGDNREGKDYFLEDNRIYEKLRIKERQEHLKRYQVAQKVDIEEEIRKSRGDLVAGCKGDDCD